MKTWQVCPVCQGAGHTIVSELMITCSVCVGRKIISSETGLPPKPEEEEDPKPKKRARPVSLATWEAYSRAYFWRYKTEPVRNARVNANLSSLVRALGEEEAPLVAEFYLSHPDAFYVKNLHSVGLLIRDAEKLRTEWKTGRAMTGAQSRQVEAGAHYREQLRRIEEGEL